MVSYAHVPGTLERMMGGRGALGLVVVKVVVEVIVSLRVWTDLVVGVGVRKAVVVVVVVKDRTTRSVAAAVATAWLPRRMGIRTCWWWWIGWCV
jgi:hypothetical protein